MPTTNGDSDLAGWARVYSGVNQSTRTGSFSVTIAADAIRSLPADERALAEGQPVRVNEQGTRVVTFRYPVPQDRPVHVPGAHIPIPATTADDQLRCAFWHEDPVERCTFDAEEGSDRCPEHRGLDNPGSAAHDEDMPATNILDYTCRLCGEEFSTVTETLSHGCPTPAVTDWRFTDATTGQTHLWDGARWYGREDINQRTVRQIANHLEGTLASVEARQQAIGQQITAGADTPSGATRWLASFQTPAAPAAPTVITNRYAGACRYCGSTVEAGAGQAARTDSGWAVQHADNCPGTVALRDGSYEVSEDGARRIYVVTRNDEGRQVVRRRRSTGGEIRLTADHQAAARNRVARQCPQAVPVRALTVHPQEGTPETAELPLGYYALANGIQIRFTMSRGSRYRQSVRRAAIRRGATRGWVYCTVTDAERRIRESGISPREAITNYGASTGSCGVCGRTLTDPESIALNIGPVCLARLNAQGVR